MTEAKAKDAQVLSILRKAPARFRLSDVCPKSILMKDFYHQMKRLRDQEKIRWLEQFGLARPDRIITSLEILPRGTPKGSN